METTITSKGQIVIPSRVRKNFGIEEGTRIELIEDRAAGVIILKPVTAQNVHSLRGMLKGTAALEALKDDRQKERDL
ncbi:MAG TPA: AbrB/MazE/SpoVT family DNA-binding domain-containing protein [Anaerolineae bacterium]|nr:AbrB/MazE/SpoVT family DNA-binding domain-containing protein [Anaerolineae bacterium]